MTHKNYIAAFILLIVAALDLSATGIFLPVIINKITHAYHVNANAGIITVAGLLVVLSPSAILIAPLFGAYSDYGKAKPMRILCFSCGLAAYLISLLDPHMMSISIRLFFLMTLLLGNISQIIIPLYLSGMTQRLQGKSLIYSFSLLTVVFSLTPLAAHFATEFANSTYYSEHALNQLTVIAAALEALALIITIALPASMGVLQKAAAPTYQFMTNLYITFMALLKRKLGLSYLLFTLFCFGWNYYYEYIPIHLTFHLRLAKPVVYQLLSAQSYGRFATLIFVIPFLLKKPTYRILRFGVFIAILGILGFESTRFVESIPMLWFSITCMSISFALCLPFLWYSLVMNSDPRHIGFSMGISSSILALSYTSNGVITRAIAKNSEAWIWLLPIVFFVLFLFFLQNYRGVIFEKTT